MSDITIDSLTLDKNYEPTVNVSFEYFKTQGEEIIGGIQKYSISGTVSVSSMQEGSTTGSTVMQQLKAIRDLGKKTKCSSVSIPSFYSGYAKIDSVSIDQGPDPAWVNRGSFTIELSAPLSSIPPNSFGIKAEDNVVEINKSETIEIGEDAHGYVITETAPLKLSKAFVTLKNQISLTCRPLCANSGSNTDVISLLRRLASTTTIHSKYKNWIPYLQSRSLELSTDGTASFSSDIILLPPGASGKAFADIEYEYGRDYQSKGKTKKTSGTITGLAQISWSDLISLSDTSSASKLANAESVFGAIKTYYSNLDTWKGLQLELNEIGDCPPKDGKYSIGKCGNDDDDDLCLKPISSTISKSRTEGTISFSFEWGNTEECTETNGKHTEVTVDIIEPQANIVEHIIPDKGTLVQNLNCRSAKTIEFTSTTTDPEGGGCSQQNECDANAAINEQIKQYIPLNDSNWLIIGNSITTTDNSLTIKIKYIRKCIK